MEQNQSKLNHIAFLLDGGFPNNIAKIFQITKMEKYENYRKKIEFNCLIGFYMKLNFLFMLNAFNLLFLLFFE